MNVLVEREIRIVLLVESKKLSSVAIASLLGLSPDESWERGASFRTGQREKHRDSSRWAVIDRLREHEDCLTALDRLLSRVEPLVTRFCALPSDSSIYLRMIVDDNIGVFGLGLDKRHVSFLASIGASIDISVAVYT